jgi:hypothetical protein
MRGEKPASSPPAGVSFVDIADVFLHFWESDIIPEKRPGHNRRCDSAEKAGESSVVQGLFPLSGDGGRSSFFGPGLLGLFSFPLEGVFKINKNMSLLQNSLLRSVEVV